MREQFEISVPQDWGDITLKQYLALQKDLDNYKDDKEAQEAILLVHLCGLSTDKIQSMTKESYNTLIGEMAKLFREREHQLQPIIKFTTKDYGFEPNLSKMSYGAYVDITKYDVLAIDDNWANIMNILYRPVTKIYKDSYSIQPYDGELSKDKWYDVTMDVHFGAYFFFVHLLKDLQNSILNSTIQTSEIPRNTKSTLEKSGKHIQQLSNLQEETSNK